MYFGFEFVSVWWTFPAVAISVLLMLRYGPRSHIAISQGFKRGWRSVRPSQWINVGIAICFFGSIIDNAYWFIAWSQKYAGLNYDELFAWGVYINVPFRQLPLLIGATLHVLAESLSHPNAEKRRRRILILWRTFWISSLAGFLFSSVLSFIRIGIVL